MSFTIFYSWQSDIRSKYNRQFINNCLDECKKKLNKKINLQYSIDKATENRLGTIDITESIFSKICEANVFIGDVTPINSDSQTKSKVPNPNVLIELGYAASQIGWENIICIQNLAFGGFNDLPFDLRQRRTLTYKLDGYSTKKEYENEKKLLIEKLIEIIENLDNSKLSSLIKLIDTKVY